MTKTIFVSALIILILIFLSAAYAYRAERCIGTYESPVGHSLKICYLRNSWNYEGFDVIAKFSYPGGRDTSLVVDNVDIPEDVDDRFSGTHWEQSLGAFVDAQGNPIVDSKK